MRALPGADKASKKEWQRSKFDEANASDKFWVPQQDITGRPAATILKMYSMHHGELSRLRRGFANSTSGEQAPRPSSCECEVDSDNKLPEPHRMGLHKYDARCCIIFMERYRSGHNGADSKSVCAQAHEGSNPSLSANRNGTNLSVPFFIYRSGDVCERCRGQIKRAKRSGSGQNLTSKRE